MFVRLMLLACLLLWLRPVFAVEPASAPALSADGQKNLIGWFDAADAASLVMDGDRIATWKDRSGQGHDLSQEDAAARPRRVVSPTGTWVQGGRMMAKGVAATLPDMTIYAAVKVAPDYSPIIAFRTDNRAEFCAAGWTIGARPTLFSGGSSTDGNTEIEDNQWHVLTFVRKGAERAFYLDGVEMGRPTGKDAPCEMTDLLLFAYSNAAEFHGSLAELLIYGAAQAPAQVSEVNQYLLRKWSALLPNPASDLVCFVGNSMTTGMYCGNGKTWSCQAAGKVPGLTRWYNISKGGITTQGLAALAATSIDPLLKRGTGRSVLVLWEGTNDLCVNQSDAAAAAEALKQFCLARRAAGWRKILILTVLPRQTGPTFEPRRIALNQLLRDACKDYADGLVDVAAIPEMGAAGNELNKDYYADGVHLTAGGNGLVADAVAPALSKLLPLRAD